METSIEKHIVIKLSFKEARRVREILAIPLPDKYKTTETEQVRTSLFNQICAFNFTE